MREASINRDATVRSTAAARKKFAWSRVDVHFLHETIRKRNVFASSSMGKLHRSERIMHFSLDFIFVSPYIWITLRSFWIANFDVRENHSMKNATKKAAKKAPAKKAPAKKKK
jgi:hypothetical protein